MALMQSLIVLLTNFFMRPTISGAYGAIMCYSLYIVFFVIRFNYEFY